MNIKSHHLYLSQKEANEKKHNRVAALAFQRLNELQFVICSAVDLGAVREHRGPRGRGQGRPGDSSALC